MVTATPRDNPAAQSAGLFLLMRSLYLGPHREKSRAKSPRPGDWEQWF